MAMTILPPTNLFDIASKLETEADKLKAGIELMNGALLLDSEQDKMAKRQLFFLTEVLSDLQKRLEVITAAAYDCHRKKVAA
ncbi:MAG: hypothetical protein ACYCZH_09715 [Sulfuriferula sp.]